MLTQHLLLHVKSFQVVKHTVEILVIFLKAIHFPPCQGELEQSGENETKKKTTLKPAIHFIKLPSQNDVNSHSAVL